MDAGQLDRRIEITRTTTVANPDEPWIPGEETTVVVAAVRAQLLQQSTEEFMRSYGESQEQVVAFRIRYRSDIVLTDQVVFGNKVHDLVEVKEIGLREGLELRARAVT
jgi:head-tail adaptor